MLRVRPPNPRRPPRRDVPADLAEDGEVAAENGFTGLAADSGHRTSSISSSEDVVQLVEHGRAGPAVLLLRTDVAVFVIVVVVVVIYRSTGTIAAWSEINGKQKMFEILFFTLTYLKLLFVFV